MLDKFFENMRNQHIARLLGDQPSIEEPKQERVYSEEDMIAFMQFIVSQESLGNTSSVSVTTAKYYLEQFKKK